MNISQHLSKLTKHHLNAFIKSPMQIVAAYQNKGLQVVNGDASTNNKMVLKRSDGMLFSDRRNLLDFQGILNNNYIEKPSIKKIIDPLASVKIEISIPVSKILNIDLNLPSIQKRELIDPTKGIIEKKAHRMLIARKKKMKKHQRRKWLKRFKTQLEKKKIEEYNKWLKTTKDELQMLDAKGSIFSPDDYVNERLEKIHWKKPRTRVYGILCPKWVIEEYEKKVENRKSVQEKLKYCEAVRQLKNDS